jgi:hypothetical protein
VDVASINVEQIIVVGFHKWVGEILGHTIIRIAGTVSSVCQSTGGLTAVTTVISARFRVQFGVTFAIAKFCGCRTVHSALTISVGFDGLQEATALFWSKTKDESWRQSHSLVQPI